MSVNRKISSIARFFLALSFAFMCQAVAIENVQQDDQPVFVFTTQKSGTHLLVKALSMIVNSDNLAENGILWYHVDPDNFPEGCMENTSRKLLLIRDPRDIFIAQIYFLAIYPWRHDHPWIRNQQLYEHVNELPFDERLAWMISHPDQYFGISESIEKSVELMKDPLVSVIRFEDLVGPSGGGDRTRQEKAVAEIAQFVGRSLSSSEIAYISDHLFGNTNSFRKGQIGSWKEHFSTYHKELFKEFMGQELIDFGYEENSEW